MRGLRRGVAGSTAGSVLVTGSRGSTSHGRTETGTARTIG